MMSACVRLTTFIAIFNVGLTVSAAEQSTPISESTNTDETTEVVSEPGDTADTAENNENAVAPKDTLGGAGLKDKKLSVVFEQFVPSETISADNAVPFPTDI